jgi:hypothetical protein
MFSYTKTQAVAVLSNQNSSKWKEQINLAGTWQSFGLEKSMEK